MEKMKETGPKISIVIPVYNAEDYLKPCLDSVIHQTYANIEIICINDGSSDSSLDILNEYANKDSRIKVFSKPNGGISSTRNYAKSFVKGKYLMYLDSDDWIEKNTCEIAIDWADRHKADVVFWNYIREFQECQKPKMILGNRPEMFDTSIEIARLQRRFLGLYEDELKHPENANALDTVWGKLYRTDIIINKNLDFVDLDMIGTDEDGLFNLLYFEYVHCAVYLPNCFNHYRKTTSSLTKKYKPKMLQQWGTLHEYMRTYITHSNKSEDFHIALNNRICLSIIGLGMNILRADRSVKKIHNIKEILSAPEYRTAIRTLKIRYFPLHWKFFFILAKSKMSVGVYWLLCCIRKIKE